MAVTRDVESIISHAYRQHSITISSKFGVKAYEAIPPPYRPDTQTLSYALIATLSEFSLRVPSLPTFRKLLSEARERRPVGDQVLWEDRCLQPRDVVVALEQLDQEEEGSQSAPRQNEEEKTQYAAETDEDQPTPTRAKLSRASKSAARTTIRAWTSQLKPTRTGSLESKKLPIMASQPTPTIEDNDEEGSPPLQIRPRQSRTANPTDGTPGSSPPPKASARPRRRLQRGIRQRNIDDSTDGVSSSSPLPEASAGRAKRQRQSPPGSARKRNRSRASVSNMDAIQPFSPTISSTRVSRGPRVAEKQTPKKKSSDMMLIKDPAKVTDFNSLRYPLEARRPWVPGTFLVMESAKDFEEWVDENAEKLHIPSRLRVAKPSSSKTEMRRSYLDVNPGVKALRVHLKSIKAAARNVLSWEGSTTQRREQVEEVTATFITAIKAAHGKYEEELGKLDVEGTSASGQNGYTDSTPQTETPQAEPHPARLEAPLSMENPTNQFPESNPRIVDLTVGYVDSDSDEE